MRYDERTYDAYPPNANERVAYPDADPYDPDAIMSVQDVELGIDVSQWLDTMEDETDIEYRGTKAVDLAWMRQAMA